MKQFTDSTNSSMHLKTVMHSADGNLRSVCEDGYDEEELYTSSLSHSCLIVTFSKKAVIWMTK